MRYILDQINSTIYPYRMDSLQLKNIIVSLIEQIYTCYPNELGTIDNMTNRKHELCAILHTHCYNSTYTTKKAIKNTLKKYLTLNEYTLYGLKLLYAILSIGKDITLDRSVLLIEEIEKNES